MLIQVAYKAVFLFAEGKFEIFLKQKLKPWALSDLDLLD